ncbi:hypothetical protein LDENG_00050510 [Lucifuga dentata]|nr:hypothetical protein LDENG_00050510 [Lucifuga dentata]
MAECNLCSVSVWRGGSSVRNFNTTNLIKQKHHEKEYDDFLKVTTSVKKCVPQQTLLETFQRCEKLPPDSNKAKIITEKVVEFVGLDDQPLSVVENVGFWHLIEHLEPRYTSPKSTFHLRNGYPKQVQASVQIHFEALGKRCHGQFHS